MRSRRHILGACLALLIGSGAVIAPTNAYAAPTETVAVSMPFGGRWGASNSGANDCSNFGAHPSCHENSSGDWAIDVYAPAGSDVKANFFNPSAGLQLDVVSVSNSSCGAGKSVRVRVRIGGTDVGWVQYSHLDTSIGVGGIGNDSVLGKTKMWPYASCWQVTTSAGVHTHLELKNTVDRSCYNPLTRGATYNYGQWIGNLGKPGVSGTRQPCPPGTPAGQAQPGTPAATAALTHGSRVNLKWNAVPGAIDYQVIRNGTLLATTTSTNYLDVQVSPRQQYSYAITARNSSGTSSAASVLVDTRSDSADRAYLSTKDGPALCGRAGDQNAQFLVCDLLKGTTWVSMGSVANDWGYATDRNWLTNADGTVSYCRRVGGIGNEVLCDRFDGTAWTSSMSPHYDLGYHENRAYLSTKDGPAVCGRSGDASWQSLVCNVLTPSGWLTSYGPGGDWGYATDRNWLVNADGTVSYCRRVNLGNQVRCDRFDGAAWTSSTSPQYDFGYHENRAYLSTKDGPAVCGRSGDASWQSLVCNVLTPSGWLTSYGPGGDWGYATDRNWLVNADGTVSYCRRVNVGNEVRCDRFDGAAWTSSTSPQYDLGYHENRAYLSTKDGPAVCGRSGDPSWQSLVCNILTPTGWLTSYSPGNDWGYATDRAWLTNADGTVSYCRRVGNGNQILCDRFDGAAWTSSMSPHYDTGYPDTFPT